MVIQNSGSEGRLRRLKNAVFWRKTAFLVPLRETRIACRNLLQERKSPAFSAFSVTTGSCTVTAELACWHPNDGSRSIGEGRVPGNALLFLTIRASLARSSGRALNSPVSVSASAFWRACLMVAVTCNLWTSILVAQGWMTLSRLLASGQTGTVAGIGPFCRQPSACRRRLIRVQTEPGVRAAGSGFRRQAC